MKTEINQILKIVTKLQKDLGSVQDQITTIQKSMAVKVDLDNIEYRMRFDVHKNTATILSFCDIAYGQGNLITDIDMLMNCMIDQAQNTNSEPIISS